MTFKSHPAIEALSTDDFHKFMKRYVNGETLTIKHKGKVYRFSKEIERAHG